MAGRQHFSPRSGGSECSKGGPSIRMQQSGWVLAGERYSLPYQAGSASTSSVPGPSAANSAWSTPTKNMTSGVGTCEEAGPWVGF